MLHVASRESVASCILTRTSGAPTCVACWQCFGVRRGSRKVLEYLPSHHWRAGGKGAPACIGTCDCSPACKSLFGRMPLHSARSRVSPSSLCWRVVACNMQHATRKVLACSTHATQSAPRNIRPTTRSMRASTGGTHAQDRQSCACPAAQTDRPWRLAVHVLRVYVRLDVPMRRRRRRRSSAVPPVAVAVNVGPTYWPQQLHGNFRSGSLRLCGADLHVERSRRHAGRGWRVRKPRVPLVPSTGWS
jgi:hypothetical protein